MTGDNQLRVSGHTSRQIHLCGPRNPHEGAINTTSRSKTWSQGLSPFFLGPVKLYGDFTAHNVENGWQYTKVYHHHLKDDGEPHECYFEWARKGWNTPYANRYPMGRGRTPAYSYWDGRKLPYIDARREIYCPLYAGAVEGTDAYKRLVELYKEQGELWLWDFDAYDHHALGMSYADVLSCETRKMGHAFVLAMMLDGQRVWEKKT